MDETEAAPTATPAAGVDPPRSNALREFVGKTWAILPDALVAFGAMLARTDTREDPPPEVRAAQIEAARNSTERVTIAGGQVAVIRLHGVIRPRGSWLAMLFGLGGGLVSFREQFREAMADPDVGAILIDVDSPGGQIDLVPETAAEVRAARGQGKQIVAISNTLCASAAYWIAAQADEVVATPSAQVGSIGVFTMHEDISRMAEAHGIKVTIVSAGQFKTEGNPYEPLSKTAKNALQSQVDDLYGMFTADVAAGRKTSQAAVQGGFAKGRCVLANEALRLGMIDAVETLEQTLARLGGSASHDPAPATLDEALDEDDDGPEAAAPGPTPEVTPPPANTAEPTGAEGATPPAAGATGDRPVADYLNGQTGADPAWLIR